ncbi:MAG: hypothetical protein FWE07_01860 [Turicibacter sp.]|nr:hypothetical protein [Turicibacter sp.]
MSELNNKKGKVLLLFSVFFGLLFLATMGVLIFQTRDIRSDSDQVDQNDEPVVEEQQPDEVEDYDEDVSPYELSINATDLQIELFEELMRAHQQFEELGTEAALQDYASEMARNFIADFFTLSNKESRSDVGGVQFFPDEIAADFALDATSTFYLHLGRHLETYGSDLMPMVDSVTVTEVYLEPRLMENTECEFYDFWGNCLDEPQFETTIVVYLEWTFAPTHLLEIDQFQTAARIVLMEVEDEGLRIFQIDIVQTCVENIWGECVPPTTY